MDKCGHVGAVRARLGDSLFNPASWACHKCGSTESVWVPRLTHLRSASAWKSRGCQACLTCHGVSCGRYIQEHALQHAQRSQHPLAMEINQGFVYCYECDDYILNDTPGGDIRVLRDILMTISNQDFDAVCGSADSRSRRTASLKTSDIANIVVRHRRISLMGKVFTGWRAVAGARRRPQRHVERALPRRRAGARKRTLSAGVPSASVPVPVPAGQAKPRLPPPPEPPAASQSGTAQQEEEEQAPTLPPGATGLHNLGNTCYMNSVLQILSNLDEFRERFLSLCGVRVAMGEMEPRRPKYRRLDTEECLRRVTEPREESGRGGSLSEEILALLRVMWSGRMSLVIPQGFLQALWTAVPSFKGYRQQDAQEFLCEVLDKLRDELESREEQAASSFVKQSSPSSSSLQGSEAAVRDLVGSLFSGELRSCVTCCNCGHSSVTKEPFSDLSLEFPPKFQDMKLTSLNLAEVECGLGEMLGHFTQREELGPVYACPACAEPAASGSDAPPPPRASRSRPQLPRREAEKELRLSRLPRLLRLHLKRFRWGPARNQRDKLSLHVRFPDLLSMRPYLAPDAEPHQESNYRLCGVIEHHGRGFNSGHYTSYCWNSLGRFWMHCNDARLQICSLEDVLDAQAYILFYRQEDGGGRRWAGAGGREAVVVLERLERSVSESSLGALLASEEETPRPPRRSARRNLPK